MKELIELAIMTSPFTVVFLAIYGMYKVSEYQIARDLKKFKASLEK